MKCTFPAPFPLPLLRLPPALFHFLVVLDVADPFVLPVGNAVGAVSIGFARGGRRAAPRHDESRHAVGDVRHGEQRACQSRHHVQQEVLVGWDAVDGRAQVVGAPVPEDVVYPVDRPAYWVAGLVFVDVRQEACLLSVPADQKTGQCKTWVSKANRV